MKRLIRILVVFVIALVAVSFLPLFIERTLLRSWRVDRLGDEITWGWKVSSLYAYWSNYHYQTREQSPEFWLKVNIALAFVYALLITLLVEGFIKWRQRYH